MKSEVSISTMSSENRAGVANSAIHLSRHRRFLSLSVTQRGQVMASVSRIVLMLRPHWSMALICGTILKTSADISAAWSLLFLAPSAAICVGGMFRLYLCNSRRGSARELAFGFPSCYPLRSVRAFVNPHPFTDTDKGTVASKPSQRPASNTRQG